MSRDLTTGGGQPRDATARGDRGPALPDDWMEEVVRRIVAVGDPERVILFGSRARGDARPDSDIDLLIVQETDDPPARRSLAIRRALRGIPVGKDVIVYTPEEFADWMGASLSLAGRAAREGKDL